MGLRLASMQMVDRTKANATRQMASRASMMQLHTVKAPSVDIYNLFWKLSCGKVVVGVRKPIGFIPMDCPTK